MSKSRKILSLIFCILILTILIPVLLDFHKVSGLGLQLFTWKKIPFLGDTGFSKLNIVADVSDNFLS